MLLHSAKARTQKEVYFMNAKLCLLSTGLSVFVWTNAPAATLLSGFSEALIASGISSPTAMAFAPDGRLFVCQQNGQLRVIKNDVLLAMPFLSVPVDATGERGLLGVA